MRLDEKILELCAMKVHDTYLETADANGWPIKPELNVAYNLLSDTAKELDRATAKAAITAYLSSVVPRDVAASVKFLEEAARYFSNRDTHGEDMAHWANVLNAENCNRIITALLSLSAEIVELKSRLSITT